MSDAYTGRSALRVEETSQAVYDHYDRRPEADLQQDLRPSPRPVPQGAAFSNEINGLRAHAAEQEIEKPKPHFLASKVAADEVGTSLLHIFWNLECGSGEALLTVSVEDIRWDKERNPNNVAGGRTVPIALMGGVGGNIIREEGQLPTTCGLEWGIGETKVGRVMEGRGGILAAHWQSGSATAGARRAVLAK
ncbi:hypothetical protein BV25DRAFT_1843117 [Artomyces pyxidatus]|uniref:Uncharacterized protein n=1 Tax=Artomyces pyxidatus TaxID=48021 RepID=A0ACB8SH47_9AGAM|nr:hypothetical protein BV25DRAFT_1843117 [Artomyces pyxidatus]